MNNKLKLKIWAIALFDLIVIYGSQLIVCCLIWRVMKWELSPYMFIIALYLGRLFESYLEKKEEFLAQMRMKAIMQNVKHKGDLGGN